MNIPAFLSFSVLWFFLYWIGGGVLFAVVSLFMVAKIRKALFGTVFTFLSFVCAIGSAYSGVTFASVEAAECIPEGLKGVDSIAYTVSCGIVSYTSMAALWFLVLVGLGSLLFFISRSKNQSWADEAIKEPDELVFDRS